MVLGKRRHLRVKGSFQVSWGIKGQPISGEGIISNISMTGMEMITTKLFDPLKDTIFLIEPSPKEIVPLQSKQARMMWSERILRDGVECLQCGLEFIK